MPQMYQVFHKIFESHVTFWSQFLVWKKKKDYSDFKNCQTDLRTSCQSLNTGNFDGYLNLLFHLLTLQIWCIETREKKKNISTLHVTKKQ